MLFLKQLDEDGQEAGEASVVVWEKHTLGLMKEIEDEKEKLNRTDYKRALKPRKPRPRHVIGDEKFLASTSSALLAKMNLEDQIKRRC